MRNSDYKHKTTQTDQSKKDVEIGSKLKVVVDPDPKKIEFQVNDILWAYAM